MHEGIDPIEGAEIMELLSIDPFELEDPKRFYRIKEVITFFQGNDQKRWQILKLLENNSGDRLERVWTWVQIQTEYTRMIRSLNPKHFTENIQQEIKQEFLTRENLKMLKEQAVKREVEARLQEKSTVEKRQEGDRIDSKEKSVVDESSALGEIKETRRNLEDIEILSNQLAEYA